MDSLQTRRNKNGDLCLNVAVRATNGFRRGQSVASGVTDEDSVRSPADSADVFRWTFPS
jgi:hypothetical protein